MLCPCMQLFLKLQAIVSDNFGNKNKITEIINLSNKLVFENIGNNPCIILSILPVLSNV